ncbi:MAG: toxin [Mesorhizobium sp.]|nr:toxin [Mesorhizobium sp.]
MEITWNPDKNAELKLRHGIGFESVLVAISDGRLLENRSHPSLGRYGHQRQLIVEISFYAWVVPYVGDGETLFLKTMFPSRKATKRYLERRS